MYHACECGSVMSGVTLDVVVMRPKLFSKKYRETFRMSPWPLSSVFGALS